MLWLSDEEYAAVRRSVKHASNQIDAFSLALGDINWQMKGTEAMTTNTDLDLHAETMRLTKQLTIERQRSEHLIEDLALTNEHLRHAINEISHLQRKIEKLRVKIPRTIKVNEHFPQDED